MRGRRVACLVVIGLLVFNCNPITQLPVTADPVPKTIQGQVDPNSTTGELAFPGNFTFYIQNRTNEGMDLDIMYSGGGIEYYFSPIEDSILDWQAGDPGVVVVDVEHGTYGTNDRAGFVAYVTAPLDMTGAQTFPTVELQKIPIPALMRPTKPGAIVPVNCSM